MLGVKFNPINMFQKRDVINGKNNQGDIIRFRIFNSLSPLEASIVERRAYRRSFGPGDMIVKEGDAAIGLYLLKSGEAKVYTVVKSRQIVLAHLVSGSFFGELTLLKERQRSATVIAVEKTEVLCLFRPDFLNILKHYPSICGKFLPVFSETILERIYEKYKEINIFKNSP